MIASNLCSCERLANRVRLARGFLTGSKITDLGLSFWRIYILRVARAVHALA